MPQHFLTMLELSADELRAVLTRSHEFKRLRGTAVHPRPLAGRSVAVIMEKASTRTRISFEIGIHELGGQPVALAGRDLQLGRDEPLDDTARVLSRYCQAVVLRTFGHERIEQLAAASSVPVINALTDLHHPCQILADLMTIQQHRAKGLDELSVAWVGDGNNVAHSWILAAARLGFELRLACPSSHQPAKSVLDQAAAAGPGRIIVTTDVAAAV